MQSAASSCTVSAFRGEALASKQRSRRSMLAGGRQGPVRVSQMCTCVAGVAGSAGRGNARCRHEGVAGSARPRAAAAAAAYRSPLRLAHHRCRLPWRVRAP